MKSVKYVVLLIFKPIQMNYIKCYRRMEITIRKLKAGLIIFVTVVLLVIGLNLIKDKKEVAEQVTEREYYHISTYEEFQKKLDKQEKVIFYAFSPQCGYCKQATPLIEVAAKNTKVDVYRVDILSEMQTIKDFNLTVTPTIIKFKDGKEVARIEGLLTEQEYQDFINL